jgi:hypothetical protein
MDIAEDAGRLICTTPLLSPGIDLGQKRTDLAQDFGLSGNEQIMTNRTQVHNACARNLTYQLVSPTAKDDTAPRSKRIDRLLLLDIFWLVM